MNTPDKMDESPQTEREQLMCLISFLKKNNLFTELYENINATEPLSEAELDLTIDILSGKYGQQRKLENIVFQKGIHIEPTENSLAETIKANGFSLGQIRKNSEQIFKTELSTAKQEHRRRQKLSQQAETKHISEHIYVLDNKDKDNAPSFLAPQQSKKVPILDIRGKIEESAHFFQAKQQNVTGQYDITDISVDALDDDDDSFKYNAQLSEKELEMARLETVPAVPPDMKKLTLVLLHSEDDTFKIVLNIGKKKMDIVKGWFQKCKQVVDIEYVKIFVPKAITHESDLARILYKTVQCDQKEFFLQTFIPEVLKAVASQKQLEEMESDLYGSDAKPVVVLKKNKTLEELKIVIPTALTVVDDTEKKDSGNIYEFKKPDNFNSYFVGLNPVRASSLQCMYTTTQKEEDKSEWKVKSYNDPYNALKPNFGDNAELINKKEAEEEEEDKDIVEPEKNIVFDSTSTSSKSSTNTILVLLHPSSLQTFVLTNPNQTIVDIVGNHTEYGFIELFRLKNSNDRLVPVINSQYNEVTFVNTDELNQMLLSTAQFIGFVSNHTSASNYLEKEGQAIANYIDTHFVLSQEPAQKMKASTLYDIVVKECGEHLDNTNMAGFKNRLSEYLKKAGLQKKRYSDGYYYYGIQEKPKEKPKMAKYAAKITTPVSMPNPQTKVGPWMTSTIEPDSINTTISFAAPNPQTKVGPFIAAKITAPVPNPQTKVGPWMTSTLKPDCTFLSPAPNPSIAVKSDVWRLADEDSTPENPIMSKEFEIIFSNVQK